MPVNRRSLTVLAALAALAACATPKPLEEPEGADRLDADVRAKVREGRDRGFPNLSDVPTPSATPADARDLAGDADALAAEAEILRALRAEAEAGRPDSDLPRRAAALRRDIARVRAVQASQPPIERPTPRPAPQ